MSGRIKACLICGGKYHDFNFARVELLKLLAEIDNVTVRVFEDFSNIEAIGEADFIVSYTCDVLPTEAEQVALKDFLSAGKRWFALHGTNSLIAWVNDPPPLVSTPRDAPLFMEMLGSQFLAHPPVGQYKVQVTDPEHPLVAGIEAFDTTDELYMMEHHGECHCLLHTEFSDNVEDFVEGDWRGKDPRHMVLYLHSYKAGQVLYFTLGHCRGKYDMQPLMDEWPTIDRCSWELEEYYELLRRGLKWSTGGFE